MNGVQSQFTVSVLALLNIETEHCILFYVGGCNLF